MEAAASATGGSALSGRIRTIRTLGCEKASIRVLSQERWVKSSSGALIQGIFMIGSMIGDHLDGEGEERDETLPRNGSPVM